MRPADCALGALEREVVAAGMNLVVYGPPGAGKTTVGRLAAAALGREFVDVDAWIEGRWGRPVPDYFAAGQEALFREREAAACRELAVRDDLVIAPGGGALLNPASRAALEGTGVVVCLEAPLDALVARLAGGSERPLLAGDLRARLERQLADRQALYRSFALQVSADGRPPQAVAEEALERFGATDYVRFELGASSALLGCGLLERLPGLLSAKGLRPPFVVVTETTVGPLHGERLGGCLAAPVVTFPAGEAHKTLATVERLYADCLAAGLERGGTLVAVGGGVAGDVAGFVAASLFRGVAWVDVPTTVLAMADASLGGKVGVDLPQGKNLVGAFHPPALVAADSVTLDSLPEVEVRCGLAEVIKAAIIGDADLFERLERGDIPLLAAIARAAAVKVGIVNADPYERGPRALLNLGHTLAHGLEVASGYRLRHGEAVAVGLFGAARLAELAGTAEPGLAGRIEQCLRRVGLPARCAGLDPVQVRAAMHADKKKSGGQLKYVLPRRLGDVVFGQTLDEALVTRVLEAITHDEP